MGAPLTFLSEPTLQRAGRGRYTLCSPFRAARDGVVWLVPRGLVTDGASVPPLFWLVAGHPYSPSSIRAAILHDWMCRDHSHGLSSPAVHRVFYEALRADGVAWVRAKLMWLAVRLFGPRW